MNKCIIIIGLIIVSGCANRSEVFVSADGVAVNGYDVVAYFDRERAVQGLRDWQYDWRGATWRFSTAANRDLFMRNPGKYAPQYGGYCAFGMSNGYKAATDPEAWTLVDGKLYLNYNLDVRAEWFADKELRIEKADSNWTSVRTAGFN